METSELLKKVRKIEIKTKALSRQIFSGQYHSAFKGRGMAFSEVREYQYGDDIRFIDWKVTARFHKPYVKVFEEERELTVMLLIDVSASGLFGSVTPKRETISEIAAILAFSASQNNDKVGAIFFSSEVEKYIPPQKGRTHLLRIIREMIDFEPVHKGTDISAALRFLRNVQKRKSTAFLLSDFMDAQYEDALKIACKAHELIAIHVADPMEASLPDWGLLRIQDNESGKTFMIDSSSPRNRKAFEAYRQESDRRRNTVMAKYGISHVSVRSGEDYVKPLINLFNKL
ncbi:MAG: DUF58 domain-containing protein [Bacteroides sp.]|nr:DUF58 domain-containing protein [Bacteroides sp.]MCM1085400.1 DUF58 domain-containing protein [Bacteroides sp.]